MSTEKDIATFGQQSHAEFNKRFESTVPANDVVNGPWLSSEAVNGLPRIGRDFDRSRDPTIAAQLDDLSKSEAERREEQGSTGAKRKGQPKLELKPPRYARPSIHALSPDGAQAEDMWLAAQRDIAMKNRPQQLKRNTPQRGLDPPRHHPKPDRER